MQAEEEHRARREQELHVREQERQREESNLRPSRERPPKEKKNPGCIIM